MPPTKEHYFWAQDWAWRIGWLAPIAIMGTIGWLIQPRLGALVGMLTGLGGAWWYFDMVQARMAINNGGPFEVGDDVLILKGKHKDKSATVSAVVGKDLLHVMIDGEADEMLMTGLWVYKERRTSNAERPVST
jgi:hypothetical protein